MFETVRNILIHTTEESMVILLALSSLLFIFLVAYWQYNRRRFQKLSHQIPARVVKDYLDSVIENSAALKSSLFLGDDTPEAVSVVSVDKLSGSPEGEDGVDLSRKNAEIAELRNSITVKDKIISELEDKLSTAKSSGGEPLQDEIQQLRRTLDEQQVETSAAKDELKKVIKERDGLRDMLKEYEVIEDDLSKIKSLQEENERYRQMEQTPLPEIPQTVGDVPQVPDDEEEKKEDKNESDSEALLKEFEKMLG